MLIMSWNARGLGKAEKRRKVINVVLCRKSAVLFVQETKLAVFDSRVILSIGGVLLSKVDLPLHGIPFTWSNNRVEGIWTRLDRYLVSQIILSWFPNIVQRGLPRSISDHSVIILSVSNDNWGLNTFRFFNGWLEDNKF
ncbi:hypothetical protein Dsin_002732 [Dipteronia sinensis]|uniref:Endonuclease/exonuclease/phosphatase domain-containing protein n=1 Tax=Dipteronia sinensis TaxID=43782 RepID=A0AAE0B6R4_9ROSI|nr:hypothetical protein Dsin_002732 [Dipteronia sinensis]